MLLQAWNIHFLVPAFHIPINSPQFYQALVKQDLSMISEVRI